MARIESKVIFVTTSPRTPAKMIPEIGLLHAHFAGQRWNNENQRAFMELLREENFSTTHWVLANNASQRGYHNIVLRCVRSVGASVRHPTAAINVPNNSFKANGFAAA